MFFYFIDIYNYTDSLCNSLNITNHFIINDSNFTENKGFIDKYCDNKCLILPDNTSYFINCNYSIIQKDNSCSLFVLLAILINFLLFFIYKGFFEQYIDHFCIFIWRKIISVCVKVDKPSYRYTSYNTV